MLVGNVSLAAAVRSAWLKWIAGRRNGTAELLPTEDSLRQTDGSPIEAETDDPCLGNKMKEFKIILEPMKIISIDQSN